MPERVSRGHEKRKKQSLARKSAVSRRNLLKIGGGAALAAVLAGGGGALYLANQGREKLGSNYPNILKYYPELANLPVEESGIFETEIDHNRVSYFNLTDTHFHPDLAAKLFSYFEDIANNRLSSTIVTPEGLTVSFEIVHNFSSYNGNIFIVPENAPKPSWLPDRPLGVTYLKYEDFTNLTQIRIPREERSFLANPIKNANFGLNVEACNNSLTVVSNPPNLAKYSQETFCNSIGLAISFRQTDATYSTYRDYVGGKGAIVPSGIVPFLEFSEEQYLQILPIPPVITRE